MKKALFLPAFLSASAAALIFAIAVFSCSALAGELADGNTELGRDEDNLLWYLTGSGSDSSRGLYAIVRKLYAANAGMKEKTAELLMSRYAVDSERANKLYFMEYTYHYSQDLRMFSVASLRYYDEGGELILETVMDGLTEATQPLWYAVVPNGPSGWALAAVTRRK